VKGVKANKGTEMYVKVTRARNFYLRVYLCCSGKLVLSGGWCRTDVGNVMWDR
jgi:hypothetical protein